MNKHTDVANEVVNEQINRMIEQERKELELLPLPDFWPEDCPLSKEQVLEMALHMAVMMKIVIIARFN